MEERLKFIFSNVNEWLKFAEAKNGVLIAFNGAAIWGMLQSFEEICKINEYLMFPSYIFIVSSLIGIIISLFSFMPTLKLSKKVIKEIDGKVIKNQSLIFFRDVSEFNSDKYLKSLYRRSEGKAVEDLNSYELDLANQIVANSRTAWLKYRRFFWALNVTLFGMIVPIPFMVIFWIIDRTRQ
jgi:hypothetical protein